MRASPAADTAIFSFGPVPPGVTHARVTTVPPLAPSAARTVRVYFLPTDLLKLSAAETLDGGTVLPGFSIPLAQLFAELDRQG